MPHDIFITEYRMQINIHKAVRYESRHAHWLWRVGIIILISSYNVSANYIVDWI